MKKINILLVSGSLHKKSSTISMLKCVENELKELGALVSWIDLRDVNLEHFTPGQSRETAEFENIYDKVDEADCYILGTPDYHGTPSGVIKNFLDYFWREFTGKLFGYVCASHEKGLTVMDVLRIAVRQCYGWSLPYGVSGIEWEEVEPEGEIKSEKLAARLQMMAHDIVNYGLLLKEQRQSDIKGDHPGFLKPLRK